MSTLDELLGRIDADLALPPFPPLQAVPCPPRPPEPPATYVIPPLAARLAAQSARDAELKPPPADQSWLSTTPEPRAPWWKRVFSRG